MYLLQNRHAGYVGNSPLFWAEAGGYTPWIDEAKRFTAEEADLVIGQGGYAQPGPKFEKWPADEIERLARRTVDMQDLRRVEA